MARYGLEPIPDPAVDTALREALDKVKGRLEVGVIGSIGVRRDPKAVGALVKRLGDADPQVADAAARALGKIGNLEAVEALKKALDKAPEGCRVSICEGLFRVCRCSENSGPAAGSASIYEHIASASVPEYVKTAHQRAEQSLQPRTR